MELKLTEHPNKLSGIDYGNLIAIDEQKTTLLNTLHLLLNKTKVAEWHKKHHQSQLTFLDKIVGGLPLVILEGEVGCGKTVLANSIATPLGELLDERIKCFETPSDIRGTGLVGGISHHITQAFSYVKEHLSKKGLGLLIIDEADDLATSRQQNQAHHEDRAGLNALLKEIDSISKEGCNLIVILITNRLSVFDPAIIRRASQIIRFERPNDKAREEVFRYIFQGVNLANHEIAALVKASQAKGKVAYSFSDLIQRVAKKAVYKAIQSGVPFSVKLYLEELVKTEPSPLIS